MILQNVANTGEPIIFTHIKKKIISKFSYIFLTSLHTISEQSPVEILCINRFLYTFM